MQYEVENKYPVADFDILTSTLQGWGATFRDAIEQTDIYFAHPLRDFAVTDEALRIRQIGEVNLVTYKGPKIDQATKTRREIELPLAPGRTRPADYSELLTALGFREVAEVRKRRRGGQLDWQGWSFALALDEVAELGRFIELEMVVPPRQLAAAQAVLQELAAALGLPSPERRSYLEMVLEARQ